MALVLLLLFLLVFTASYTSHSSKKLFTEPQGALTNISDFYAPNANISRAQWLAPLL